MQAECVMSKVSWNISLFYLSTCCWDDSSTRCIVPPPPQAAASCWASSGVWCATHYILWSPFHGHNNSNVLRRYTPGPGLHRSASDPRPALLASSSLLHHDSWTTTTAHVCNDIYEMVRRCCCCCSAYMHHHVHIYMLFIPASTSW